MTMILEKGVNGTGAATKRCLDISVAELESSLRGAEYPAQKHDLIARARLNGASDDIKAFLHLLPEDKYPHFYDIAFMAWSFLIV